MVRASAPSEAEPLRTRHQDNRRYHCHRFQGNLQPEWSKQVILPRDSAPVGRLAQFCGVRRQESAVPAAVSAVPPCPWPAFADPQVPAGNASRLTLDDGYRDNLTTALPIAESKGVPITVFVASGILGNHNGFWWDRLGTLLRSRPPQVREICRSVASTSSPPTWFVRDQSSSIGPPPPAAASGAGHRTGARRCLGAMAGGFRSAA